MDAILMRTLMKLYMEQPGLYRELVRNAKKGTVITVSSHYQSLLIGIGMMEAESSPPNTQPYIGRDYHSLLKALPADKSLEEIILAAISTKS
ncbi:MAG: hypothetical protein JWM56_1133 [Candidatus Peribacteria bacterium]|nr:hypothetical protein [Candidatus Peribacteria bacterium]